MELIRIARTDSPLGEPLLTERDLAIYTAAFATSGFTGGINWYRNLNRDWHQLGVVDPIIHHPALMMYGDRDTVMRAENLAALVPNVTETSLDAGHWIHQERPEEANQKILAWLASHDASAS